jgi:hypothetical protein
MNHLLCIALLACGITASSVSCASSAPLQQNKTVEREDDNNKRAQTMKMKISIGSRTFTATLEDNPAATQLKAMLPITLDMTELNGNEKYFHFSTKFPTDASNAGTIRTGDLMLWGGNSLVLFYKTFSTSYSYTRLGRIENPSDLASAVGAGNVKVTFELE